LISVMTVTRARFDTNALEKVEFAARFSGNTLIETVNRSRTRR
jgi:hypothetical protein